MFIVKKRVTNKELKELACSPFTFCNNITENKHMIIEPTITSKVIENFPVPEIGPDGIPTGRILTKKVISIIWDFIQQGIDWSILYRMGPTGEFDKPDAVQVQRIPPTREGKLVNIAHFDYFDGWEEWLQILPYPYPKK